MFNKDIVKEIRILPNSDKEFPTERDFKDFIENELEQEQNGRYYYRSKGIKCSNNTLILFQYRGLIKAIGILIKPNCDDEGMTDENGTRYKGYHQFDSTTLKYLKEPIAKDDLTKYASGHLGRGPSKIKIEFKDAIYDLLNATNGEMIEEEKEIATIQSVIDESDLLGEEKQAFVKVRVNQGVFREKLLNRYNKKCCLCGISQPEILTASHIKPWAQSTKSEKLDVNNGLLLCANHDRLFDRGYISFDDDGKTMISNEVKEADKILLNIKENLNVELNEENKRYLKYHRKEIFKKD